MNPDPNRMDPPARNVDDEQLGALVRSLADDWRMPPQRLDQPTWRDRLRSGATRRRPWPARLAGPASAALVATVVLALGAVWLTAPRDPGPAGVSPSPSTSATPSDSSSPVSTPLPRLVRNGELPSVTQVMVRAEGTYRLADLATGTLGDDALGSYSGPTALVQRPAGGWLCVCGKWTAFGANGPTGLSLNLVAIDSGGNLGDPSEVRRLEGAPNPGEPVEVQYQLVDAAITVAPDGSTAFIAWTARHGAAGWTSGIDVIDVAGGTVASSAVLPLEAVAAAEGRPITRNAPSVMLSPAGDRILMTDFWFVEDPDVANPAAGTERWTSPFDGHALGAIAPLLATSADDCVEFGSGLIDADNFYLVCAPQFGDLTVRRLTLAGDGIGDTKVARTGQEFGESLFARSGDGLYIWDPVAAIMSRIDLRTGALTQSPPASASRGEGPLDGLAALGRRIGRWIAPSVAAKVRLEPGLVLSPDGTRVYAIGVGFASPSGGGSTGVFAFDAATLAQLGHWDPTADFTSIAVSGDGRFVYAAAQGGVDALGVASRNGASVTVFDATDGSVRLIAGELGSSDLWFASQTLE
jgi:hypothetical protein